MGTSWGCESVDGSQQLVYYDFRVIGGTSLDDGKSFEYAVTVVDGTAVDTRTLELPSEHAEADAIVVPHCNGAPVF